MPSFLTKVFGRKKDGGDESPGARSGDGELLDGKFEDVSPTISPSVAHFPELQTNGSPRGRGTDRTHSDSRLRTFFRSRSRPASPTRQHRKVDELPSLPLNLFAQDAPAFDDSQLLLTDKAIGERRLTPVEVVGLVRACSQAINNRGVETLGIMSPHWYSASPDVQRRLISLFIHSLTAKSPLTGLPSFTSEINETRSPHDVAAVLRWGLRHIQLQGNGLGRNQDWYQTFFDEERKAEYPPKAFSQTLAPLIPSEHLELLREVLDIFSSLAAHAETNSTSGSKLSKVFGLWLLNTHRVESKDDWRSFYERWEVAGRQLEHVFFARIRDEAVENRVPTRLTNLVRRYPFYQDTNSPTTDLRLLPRSGFTTRVHDALLVRLDTELPNTKSRPKSKVHPLRLITEALSTAVDDTEYSGLWKKIVDASKTEGTGTPLSRIFSDETIRFLSLLPDDGAGDGKSPALSLLPISPSSPRAKRLSFSLSEFTDEIKRSNSTQSKSTAVSPSPLSPLTADADWSLFATSGFGNSPALTPLTSALFSTSSDVERTSPPSRKPSKHSSTGGPRKSVEFSPAIPSEGSKQSELPSKIALLQIVQLDEAFIDFWSDTLLDPIAADWPAFVVCRVKSTLVPELKFSPAEGQEKTLQWVVLEQGYTVKAPPPVPESATPAAAEHTERPSSPQSASKKRFSFWSPSRTGSFASSIGSTSRKAGKQSGAYERGQRVSEMGEVMEEGGASASGAPLTSIRSAASTIGGGRSRKFRTPAAEDVVRVRIPSPKGRRKSVDVKSLDATVTSKKSTEGSAEGTSAAAAAVVGGAVAAKEDKAAVEEPVAEKADETKPIIEEKAVEEKAASPTEDTPVAVTTKEGEATAATEEKKTVEEPPSVEATPTGEAKAKAEVVEQEATSRTLPVEDVPVVIEEVVTPTPEAQPAPVVEEKKPVPAEEKKEPTVEEKATPVVEEAPKPSESTPTPAKEPTNGSVSVSEKAKEKEKEKAVASPEPASVIPKGAVKSLLARFQGKKDKKEKEKAAPSPAPVEKKEKAVAPPPVPVKEEKKVGEKVEEGSTSAASSTAASVVAAGVVAGVAAGVAAVAAKKAEKEEEVVKAAPVVEETKPAEVEEEVTKPAEVQEEETKPIEVEEKEPVAVAEPTTEDTPIPEDPREDTKAEEANARELPAPEEPTEAVKDEESVPAEEAVTETVTGFEAEVPPAVVVVAATPEAEAVVEEVVAPVEEVTEAEAIPETAGEKEIDVSPAPAEVASEPTPEVIVKDEEPIVEAKPAAEGVTVEEEETSATAEEASAAPVVPVEEATEVIAIEEPAATAVAEEEATAVPAEAETSSQEVPEGAAETAVDEKEIPVVAEAPKADVEEKEAAVVEPTPAPSEEVPVEVQTKEALTEAEAPEDAPTQDEDLATAVQATIPVVEEPEKVEPAAETAPVAGEGAAESPTEVKEVVDPVETTAAQNGSAPSVSLDTPVLDTQDRSVSEAPAEVEDATKQDQPEATTDPLVESHTVANPDNQPPHDADTTKASLANSTSAAEREAEVPQGDGETFQEAAESDVELKPTEDVVEIKATSPEPHVVPATEEPIIETPTGSGDEIVTDDRDPDDIGQVAEVSEAPAQVHGSGDSDVREVTAAVEEDSAKTERTHVPESFSTLDIAAASDDADLLANDDTAPAASDSEEVVGTAAKESTPAPEETTVEAESTLEVEDSTLVSQPQEDAAAHHDEESTDKAVELAPIESEATSKEPTPEEPVSVPPVSALDASTDSAVAEAEDTPKDDTEGEQPAEDASPAAEPDPEVAVIAATTVDPESHAEEEDVQKDPVSFAAEVEGHREEVEAAAPEQVIEAQDGSMTVAVDAQDEAPEKADVAPESVALEDVIVEDGEKAGEGESIGQEELKVDAESEKAAEDGATEEQPVPNVEDVQAVPEESVVVEEALVTSDEIPPTEVIPREVEGSIPVSSEGVTTTNDDELPPIEETVSSESNNEPQPVPAPEALEEQPVKTDASVLPRKQESPVPAPDGDQDRSTPQTEHEVPVVIEEVPKQQDVVSEQILDSEDAAQEEKPSAAPSSQDPLPEADFQKQEEPDYSSAEATGAGEDEGRAAPGDTESDGPAEPHTVVDEKQTVENAPLTERTSAVEEPEVEQTEVVQLDEKKQVETEDAGVVDAKEAGDVKSGDVEEFATKIEDEEIEGGADVQRETTGELAVEEAGELKPSEEEAPEQEARVDVEETTELDTRVEAGVAADEDSKFSQSTEEQQNPTEDTSQILQAEFVQERSSLDSEVVKQEDAAPDETDGSSVLSSIPHLEPLNTKDDDPSDELVELPPVPLAGAPIIPAAASEHALVPVTDLNDDSLDPHRHHATTTAVEPLPPAIEHTLEVGSTPSAEALLDAVQSHGRALSETSPANKLTVDVEELRSSPTEATDVVAAKAISGDPVTTSNDPSNESAELRAIPAIQTENASDDETKRVPAPLDLRLAETLAEAQDLPSAIEQAAVAGLTPEALLDAVQATLSATVFAPEPAVPTNTAQNEDGKEGQANEAPSIPFLNGNGRHHVPDSEASLGAEGPKGLSLATTIAEETAQPTETATDVEKPVEPTSLAAEELTSPLETQDAATTITEEKTTAPRSVLPESTLASEEDTTAQNILATAEPEEKASIASEPAFTTAEEPAPGQLPEVNDDPNATDEKPIATTNEAPEQTVAPDTETPDPAAESTSTVDEQDGTAGATEGLEPAAYSEASIAEAEGTAAVVAEKGSPNFDKVLSPAEEQIPTENGEDARVATIAEQAPSTTEEKTVFLEGKEDDTDVASDRPVVNEDPLATSDDPASGVDKAEVATTLVEEPTVEERKDAPAVFEAEVVESETAPEEVPSTSEESSSTTVDKQSTESEEEVSAPAAEEITPVGEVDVISKPEVELKTEDDPPTAEEPALPTAESKDTVALLEPEVKVDAVGKDAPFVEGEEDVPVPGVEIEKDVGPIVSEPEDRVTTEDKSHPSAEGPVQSKEAVGLVISEEADTSVVEGEENVKPTTGTAEDVASSTAGTNA